MINGAFMFTPAPVFGKVGVKEGVCEHRNERIVCIFAELPICVNYFACHFSLLFGMLSAGDL